MSKVDSAKPSPAAGIGLRETAREKRALLVPAMAMLALGLLLAAGSLGVATVELNRTAEAISRKLAEATLAREKKRVAELTIDYAFWDQAILKLTVEPDTVWADQNIGSYLHGAFGINFSAVLDEQGKTRLIFQNGVLAANDEHGVLSAALIEFMLANNSTEAGENPAMNAHLHKAQDGMIYIVGFAPFTPETKRFGDIGMRRRPTLVLARKLDEAMLDELGRFVMINNLRIDQAAPQSRVFIPLTGPVGNRVGYASWEQDYPGEIILWRMLPGVAGILTVMAILLYMQIRRADEVIQARQIVAKELSHERALNEIRQRFVSMISHEVRTPLANIQSATDLLRLYWLQMTESERTGELGSIQNSITTINSIIDDVLSLDRIEFSATSFEPVDLAEICREQWRELVSASRTKHNLVMPDADEQFFAHTDIMLTRTIIRNLLSNAMKYSPDGSTVSIGFREDEKTIYLCIEDQGYGIPKEDADLIFNPFFRGSNVGHIKGIGIGLSIVKTAVNLMGGSVHLRPGKLTGTSVELALPKA